MLADAPLDVPALPSTPQPPHQTLVSRAVCGAGDVPVVVVVRQRVFAVRGGAVEVTSGDGVVDISVDECRLGGLIAHALLYLASKLSFLLQNEKLTTG